MCFQWPEDKELINWSTLSTIDGFEYGFDDSGLTFIRVILKDRQKSPRFGSYKDYHKNSIRLLSQVEWIRFYLKIGRNGAVRIIGFELFKNRGISLGFVGNSLV